MNPRGSSIDFQQLSMEAKHGKELAILQNKIERLKWSSTDMTRQLSDAGRRMQRLAESLGFDNVYEAQVALDTADTEVPYKNYLELVQQLERTLAAERAEVTRLNDKLRVVEEENKTLKSRAQGIW
jgi:prefoldin subunit 5